MTPKSIHCIKKIPYIKIYYKQGLLCTSQGVKCHLCPTSQILCMDYGILVGKGIVVGTFNKPSLCSASSYNRVFSTVFVPSAIQNVKIIISLEFMGK